MDTSFSHVALLVPGVETSAQFLNARGIETEEPETFESEGTKEVYVGSYESQRGLLLLLEAISDGPYKRAMTKRGPSLHHIAIDVLNIDEFVSKAKSVGWKLHAVNAETMAHKTAWLFLEGVPTLIEAHQKRALSAKPLKVSKLDLPIKEDHLPLFKAIGLGDVVSPSDELCLTVDGQKMPFNQMACLD